MGIRQASGALQTSASSRARGVVPMRTASEIKAKIRQIKRKLKTAPTFWNVMQANIFIDCLQWYLAGKRK
jgi:hypothetical protein